MVDDLTIHVILVLTVMAGWIPQLVDVKGAFLHGESEEKHKMYKKVPQGFEKWYGRGVFLLLLKALYGTKQAASRFWVLLQSVFLKVNYKRSNIDPSVFHKWSEKDGLVVWLSWVDDCLCTGKTESVEEAKEEFKKEFEVDNIGPLEEYGCMHTACAHGLIISPETNAQKSSRGRKPKYFLDNLNVEVMCIPLKPK